MNPSFKKDLMASYPRSKRFLDNHCCPRGAESGREGNAVWSDDETCTYCGSLHPDLFMERLEAGNVILGPTDKNYKVYVKPKDDALKFQQSFRDENSPKGDDPTKWVWTTRESDHAKFYFQHLSEQQKQRFVELLNEKKLNIDYPGHFYRRPFFITIVPPTATPAPATQPQ